MVGSRTATAVVGLLASLLLSAILWWYFDTVVFFLFVPFVPFFFRGARRDLSAELVRECPTCGFRTTNDAYEYRPRDATRLE